jgi:Tol biopolymer transport system component
VKVGLIALLVGIALATLASAAKSGPPKASFRNTILYARYDHLPELLTIRVDRTDRRVIARGDLNTGIGGASWSPDGRRIAFSLGGARSSVLLLVRRQGGHVQRITSGHLDYSPIWSPNGRWIAFIRQTDRTWSLDVIHSDGTGLRELASTSGSYGDLSWAPSSRALLATMTPRLDVPDQPIICSHVVLVAIGKPAQVQPGGACAFDAEWSPDGSRFAFVALQSGANVIMVERPGGAGARQLTTGPNDLGPTWSPRGRQIAFGHFDPKTQTRELSLIGADGTGLRRVSASDRWDYDPVGWSPDGRWILLARTDPAEAFDADLLVVRPNGGRRQRIADNTSFGTASWRPH